MIVTKFGKVRVYDKKREDGYGGWYIELEMLVQNFGGRNYITTTMTKHTGDEYPIVPPYAAQTWRGINPDNEESLTALFNRFLAYGLDHYEWIEPLTEVN